MRSPAVPFTVLVVVAAATFALAMWHPFSPGAAAPPDSPSGPTGTIDFFEPDPERGTVIYAESCAGCHGADGEGGVGPALRGSGLEASAVMLTIASGRGVMPAAIVSGQDAADVAAHVASIAK
jgi:cytochrome c550